MTAVTLREPAPGLKGRSTLTCRTPKLPMCRQHAERLSHIMTERLEDLRKTISALHCCSSSGLKCGKMPLKAEVTRSESPMITGDLTVMTHFTFISLSEDMQNPES